MILDHFETNQGHCHQRCFLLADFFLEVADFGGALSLMRCKSVKRARESVNPDQPEFAETIFASQRCFRKICVGASDDLNLVKSPVLLVPGMGAL